MTLLETIIDNSKKGFRISFFYEKHLDFFVITISKKAGSVVYEERFSVFYMTTEEILIYCISNAASIIQNKINEL